jgi:hypothetical protein
MALESSQRELQYCFRPHPNPRSEQEVMDAQSLGSPNRDNFGTPVCFNYKNIVESNNYNFKIYLTTTQQKS